MTRRKAAMSSLIVTVAAALLLAGCVTTGGGKGKGKEPDMLSGLVLDAEGKPIPFAKISILPQAPDESMERGRGTTETLPDGTRGLAVTTEGGRWVVDHVSDEAGTDLGMPPGYYYEVTIYKPGYHIWRDAVLYDRGTLQVDTTLYPDTIDVEDVGNLVDTSLGETNTGTGVLRQGE
ncbi:MAG: carboxypeptidase regulatory-like domain-containing protein [Deltaproteobacteria bacterium]|nr:carboxypeptidase regulatory-like domain-containing protein [Deltaproteobacteria bacterium]